MGTRATYSRRHAVLLDRGPYTEVRFFWRKTDLELREATLEKSGCHLPRVRDRNWIIELLLKAGVTVRHYDPEEKLWLETSSEYGTMPVRGDRDGGWQEPDLNTFEQEYLGVH